MTSFERMYDTLKRYGEILADREHETTEHNFIRFTTFKYNETYYVATKFNGSVVMVAEKEDIKELL